MVESIRCYEVGAYRSAIVGAYVAVCFDLIEKLKTLAASGDAAAEREVKHLAAIQTQHERNDPTAISSLLAFERGLLELFRDKFDFFGLDAYQQLSRLRFDRNRCAHPSFTPTGEPFAPSAELSRSHIRSAVDYVISQPPRQGKAALASLNQSVLNPYFPTKVGEMVLRLKADGLENARDSVIKAFIDELAFGYTKPLHPFYKKANTTDVISAVIEINRAIALPRSIQNAQKLLASADDDGIRIGAAISINIPEVGEGLDAATQATLKTWLRTNKEISLVRILQRSLKIGWLEAQAKTRFASLTREELGRSSGKLPTAALDRAAHLYATSSNWDAANSFAAKVAVPNAQEFTEDHLKTIFSHAELGLGDLRGSHGFNDFIEALYEVSPLGRDNITQLLNQHDLGAFVR